MKTDSFNGSVFFYPTYAFLFHQRTKILTQMILVVTLVCVILFTQVAMNHNQK